MIQTRKHWLNKKKTKTMEEKEKTPMDKEGEPRAPLQSTLEEGEDVENMDKKCCGSNNHVTI